MTRSLVVASGPLAISLGLLAAASSGAVAEERPAAKPDTGMTQACLFLGRRSADGWRPASLAISAPRYPLGPGDKVVLKQDALVYERMDCEVTAASDFKPGAGSRSALFAKADGQALEVAGPLIECPSVGGAKTVWVHVSIPAARLVSVARQARE